MGLPHKHSRFDLYISERPLLSSRDFPSVMKLYKATAVDLLQALNVLLLYSSSWWLGRSALILSAFMTSNSTLLKSVYTTVVLSNRNYPCPKEHV